MHGARTPTTRTLADNAARRRRLKSGDAKPGTCQQGSNNSACRAPGLMMSNAASTSGWMMPNWPTRWPRNSTAAWRPGKKVGSSCGTKQEK